MKPSPVPQARMERTLPGVGGGGGVGGSRICGAFLWGLGTLIRGRVSQGRQTSCCDKAPSADSSLPPAAIRPVQWGGGSGPFWDPRVPPHSPRSQSPGCSSVSRWQGRGHRGEKPSAGSCYEPGPIPGRWQEEGPWWLGDGGRDREGRGRGWGVVAEGTGLRGAAGSPAGGKARLGGPVCAAPGAPSAP